MATSVPRFDSIALDKFAEVLGRTSTEVSSVALGGRIVAFSDEWFAPATDLLKVGPAASMKGQFGPAGALFDGWETRRHNPTYDWVIVRLGPAAGASIVGFDVDTANFKGNEAPEVEIFGLHLSPAEEKQDAVLSQSDPRWTRLLERVPCNPSSRHLFACANPTKSSAQLFTHVKLHMIPDGGIARFRVYGEIPAPPLGLGVSEYAAGSGGSSSTGGGGNDVANEARFNVLDLAHVMNGGRVVFTSDQHFGVGPNVLLPGRGKDMGDGWETKRSRVKDHQDWLVIKLGEPGLLTHAEIDTAHFLGNFPDSVELHAVHADDAQVPIAQDDSGWTSILPRSKTGPGRQHYYALHNVEGKPFSHVRVTMHPDGGIKRVRVYGRRAAPLVGYTGSLPAVTVPAAADKELPEQPKSLADLAGAASKTMSSWFGSNTGAKSAPAQPQRHGHLGARNVDFGTLPAAKMIAKPLTPHAFATYGDVIASPYAIGLPEQPFKSVNQGTAYKYEALSDVVSNYPAEARAKASIHVYRCIPPPAALGSEKTFGVRVMERHQFTTQAFLPMTSTDAKADTGAQSGYLVIVAKDGKDDLPDLSTLAAFIATGEQGIAYGVGVWHHPMIALGTHPTDFAVIVHESATHAELNCDEVFWDKDVAHVALA